MEGREREPWGKGKKEETDRNISNIGGLKKRQGGKIWKKDKREMKK